MLLTVLVIACAVALAWWTWRGRLDTASARVAVTLRAIGLSALLLLLVDPGMSAPSGGARPLVLLDRSVSMYAAGGHMAAAAALAASLGDTVPFGELAPGLPGDNSRLADALASAAATDRRVVVVTDGEISDVPSIPLDLLASANVRLVPRTATPDIGVTGVHGSAQLTSGDTLRLDIDATRSIGAADSCAIVVSDSTTQLLRGVIQFNGTHGSITLRGPLPRRLVGEQWLRIARVGSPDGEPGDDVRWWQVRVTPTAGVVVLAATPDFDGRTLYRTLRDVLEVPVRGYVQLQHGMWRAMEDLRPVPTAVVTQAASRADLLAVRGDPTPWAQMAKARLFWTPGTDAGDWYLTGGGVSPLTDALVGVDPDSLPAVPSILHVAGDSVHGWIGLNARLARRGPFVPVAGGEVDRRGRTVMLGADGLFRWDLRGGVAEEAWRTLIASAANWLLTGTTNDSALVRVVSPVVQRGEPVHFHWTGIGAATPVPILVRSVGTRTSDTLRFDANNDASLALPVGRYDYTLLHGSGAFMVEPYSDELITAPQTLRDHAGTGASTRRRRSLRDLIVLFAIAVAGFAGEWLLRRRLGLR